MPVLEPVTTAMPNFSVSIRSPETISYDPIKQYISIGYINML